MFFLIVIPLILIAAVVLGATLLRRRAGYGVGTNVVVRCRSGHLFSTVWIPRVSFKAIRLGPVRFQRCPVGNHWTLVRAVREADLTEQERRFAMDHRDLRIP